MVQKTTRRFKEQYIGHTFCRVMTNAHLSRNLNAPHLEREKGVFAVDL
jgi:hypothetical protein